MDAGRTHVDYAETTREAPVVHDRARRREAQSLRVERAQRLESQESARQHIGSRQGDCVLVTARGSIPLFGQVSSLNVSVAAGVLLFEARRQRVT